MLHRHRLGASVSVYHTRSSTAASYGAALRPLCQGLGGHWQWNNVNNVAVLEGK
jgi:hypothetical protein